MRIAEELLTEGGFTVDPTPCLRIADEEALVAGEAIDHRRFPALERDAVRAVRLGEPAQVADVLSHRELRVHLRALERRQHLELRAQLRGALLECLRVLRRPP